MLRRTYPRSRAAASRSASASATGVSPNVSVVALASITNGRVNWYRVVRSSLTIALNTPVVHSTGYGIALSFGAGAPFASVNSAASWRTVSAGFVGTSHTWPYARSSAATVTSVFAQSVTDVQLCGTSSGAGE